MLFFLQNLFSNIIVTDKFSFNKLEIISFFSQKNQSILKTEIVDLLSSCAFSLFPWVGVLFNVYFLCICLILLLKSTKTFKHYHFLEVVSWFCFVFWFCFSLYSVENKPKSHNIAAQFEKISFFFSPLILKQTKNHSLNQMVTFATQSSPNHETLMKQIQQLHPDKRPSFVFLKIT